MKFLLLNKLYTLDNLKELQDGLKDTFEFFENGY
jgi:hypothetical protein